MNLQGKRIAILVEQQYQELEVWYPLLRFLEAGAEVVCLGPEAGKVYPSKLGYPVKADQAYADADPSTFHGVIAPGGWAPDYIRRHPAAIDFVKALHQQNKLVAAICHGPWILCSADVLRGKNATCFLAVKDDVVHAGAIYQDAEVVTDGNIVTSRKPEDLPAFCLACGEVLSR
jgi:protease I